MPKVDLMATHCRRHRDRGHDKVVEESNIFSNPLLHRGVWGSIDIYSARGSLPPVATSHSSIFSIDLR
jgi:hypothetical protein